MSEEKKEIRIPIIEATEIDLHITKQIREFCKWIMDLLRNVIIVGVIQYMAAKTGNVWIRAVSWISYGALL